MENDLKFIIQNAIIKDFNSSFYNQKVDLLIHEGIIEQIADTLDEDLETIDVEGLELWPGLCDFRVHYKDPGEEYKENIETGLDASLAGGITAVGIVSSTTPPVSNKSIIEYIKQKSDFSMVDAHPYGVVSENLHGENLAELYDMWTSGAAGFTDDCKTLSPSLLIRALEYVQNFNGLIIQNPCDLSIFPNGQINEGIISTQNGMKGLPSIMEFTTLQQNIEILRYTGGQIHFAGISCAESVAIIRAAKKEGLNVTADVNIANLLYTEDDTKDFDTNFKLFPPLRTQADQDALVAGVKDGTIDVVCSDHRPEDQENKKVEFENAAFGRIGTQTLFSELKQLDCSDEIIYNVLIKNPRNLLKSQCPSIETQHEINAFIFDSKEQYIVDETTQFSLSKNTNLWSENCKGKVKGVLKGTEIVQF